MNCGGDNARPPTNRFTYTSPRGAVRPSVNGAKHVEHSRRHQIEAKMPDIIEWVRKQSGVTLDGIVGRFHITTAMKQELRRQLGRAEKAELIAIEKERVLMRDHLTTINIYLTPKQRVEDEDEL